MSEINRDLHLFADGREIAQSCRMRLTARENLSLTPQLFQLEIENLSGSSAAFLSAARSLEVRSEGSVLAAGEPVSVCPRRQSGKRILSVSFSPGISLWEASVSLSLAAGMRVSDSVRAVLSAAVYPPGAARRVPLAAFTAEDAVLTRPQAFFGRACDALRVLAGTVRAKSFLAPSGLCVIDPRPQTPALILPESSLLSEPVELRDRVLLTTAAAGWPLGSCLRLEHAGRAYQGLPVSRLLRLDNVSGPWLSQLEVLLPAPSF